MEDNILDSAKPSTRIFELIAKFAANRLESELAAPNADFMMKITGSTKEGMLESLKYSPGIQIAALIQYLDETAESAHVEHAPSGEATNSGEAKP